MRSLTDWEAQLEVMPLTGPPGRRRDVLEAIRTLKNRQQTNPLYSYAGLSNLATQKQHQRLLLLLFKFRLSEKLDLSEAAVIRLLSRLISVTAYFPICRISQRGCCVWGAHTVAYITIPRRHGAEEAAQAVAASIQSFSSRPLKVN